MTEPISSSGNARGQTPDAEAALAQFRAYPSEETVKLLAGALREMLSLDAQAHLIGELVQGYIRPYTYQRYFKFWQEYGFHVTPVHFYYPIPDTRTLGDEIWQRQSALAGIDMDEPGQLALVRDVFPAFAAEYNNFPQSATDVPYEFYLNNKLFDGTDALALYCMLRYLKPRHVIEVGSGFSSLIAAHALVRNRSGELVCIEPYPTDVLKSGVPGLSRLIPEPVQSADPSIFEQLESGDVLFIDSSHVVRIGSDVNVLYLEVLPRLRPGVVVHVHDIFLPREYPREWVLDEARFWTEQYLLQAFLMFNSEFHVLLSNSFLAEQHLTDLKTTFPNSPWWGGASLWMQRRSRGEAT